MDAKAFLALRTPRPPEALEAWLAAGTRGGDATQALVDQALDELSRSRAVPGRVRDGAWHLLAADALLTYACEAALDGSDPPGMLEDVLRKAAAGES